MNQIPNYPLRFEPIFQYRLWGGRRLADLVSAALPGDGPIGEAWLLSDRDDHPSIVADGPLKGQTLRNLLTQSPHEVLGKLAGRFDRFPLLLKFLDVSDRLSVQVHPSDLQTSYLPAGEHGKTEAWVVLRTDTDSRIYAGLRAGSTSGDLRQAIAKGALEDHLANFTPTVGDAVLVPAGTVHSLSHLVVFEVQENSDVTFRLYDWNHVDARTGNHRPLQVEQAMACIDFDQAEGHPATPVVEAVTPVHRERLFVCEHFGVWRIHGESPFMVGAPGTPRVLVCLAGNAALECGGAHYAFRKGDVILLPAVVEARECRPAGAMTLLEVSLPEGA